MYKNSITGNTYNIASTVEGYKASREGTNDAEIAMPLKYLGNFWRNLDILLINCEISLTLSWYERCVITSLERRADTTHPDGVDNSPTDEILKINCKLYVPVVTLSSEEDNKLLDQLKSGFKRTIKWNKYMSQMSNQNEDNNLNYLIDPTFTNVNRLFVLSFENYTDRTSYSKYYFPKADIKDYNVMIDGKPFSEEPIKNKKETYEKIIEICKNSNYTTGNLLDYEYFTNYYNLIAIDLSKQIELENEDLRQQISFIARLKDDATMFFIIEKKRKLL